MSDRNISEIILSLEEKVESLTKQVANNESLLKNLLNSVNRLVRQGAAPSAPTVAPPAVATAAPPAAATAAPAMEPELEEPKSRFERLKEMHGITDQTTNVQDLKSGFRKIDRAAVSASNINVKKTSVTQQVTYQGTPLIVAAIEIKNLNGKIVESCRTNQKGIWVASLEPGDYIVFVIKRFVRESKQPIEAIYEISVAASDSAVVLETKDL
jgi:hypothetical protein